MNRYKSSNEGPFHMPNAQLAEYVIKALNHYRMFPHKITSRL